MNLFFAQFCIEHALKLTEINSWKMIEMPSIDCSEWIFTHTHTGNVCLAYTYEWCIGVLLTRVSFRMGIYRVNFSSNGSVGCKRTSRIFVVTPKYLTIYSKDSFDGTGCRSDAHDDKIIMMMMMIMMVSAYKGIVTIVGTTIETLAFQIWWLESNCWNCGCRTLHQYRIEIELTIKIKAKIFFQSSPKMHNRQPMQKQMHNCICHSNWISYVI